jgi:hypothetical protein
MQSSLDDLRFGDTLPEDLTMYILFPNELTSLVTSPGKLAAQAAHAGNQLVAQLGEYPSTKSYLGDRKFGTCIVLRVPTVEIVGLLCGASDCHDAYSSVIYDPTYPFTVESMEIADLLADRSAANYGIYDDDSLPVVNEDGTVLMVRHQLTCGWIFGSKAKLQDLLGEYPLF